MIRKIAEELGVTKYVDPSVFEEIFNEVKGEKGIIIAVTGPSVSGKSTFAKKLAEELNYFYFYAGTVFRKMAEKTGFMDFYRIAENDPGIDIFIDKFTEILADYCREKGIGAVFDGRLTHIFAKPDLKILVTCSFEERVKRLAERENLSLKEAERTLRERDESDKKRYKEFYGIDLEKSWQECDIIVDTTNYSLEDTYKKVKEIAEYIKKLI